ncbi:MAG TPA: hypothetical protein VMG37_22240 [Solirubrobacteraceae bacterium]|nr:hypothetical protein [Solirubrobacteraceae bacterium]
MPNPNPALLPSPALFDVTTVAQAPVEGKIERIALENLELAPNPRKHISHDSIQSLAALLMRTGQLIPCIGHRPTHDHPTVLLYDGQRRLLAAKASQELAGTDGFEGLAPVRTLIVLLLDHEPTPDEIRRIQARANQREELSLLDQQQQFADCWRARAGLPDDDRVLAVCADLGISPRRAHNLRRQLTLPEPIRERVAERPTGQQLSVTMANRLADMHEIAPELTEAVAQRITSTDLHDSALRDLGAFVHRTIVEDEHTYAVRIDDGALLDAAEQIERARLQLTPTAREQLAQILACEHDKLDRELDTLTARAKTKALKIKITPETRDRARAGRFAYVHRRGQDFADGIWVVNPVFMIDLVREHLADHQNDQPAREEAFFAGAALDDDELRTAGQEDRERRNALRLRQAEATNSNLGLGHDLRAGLMDPTPSQLHALKAIICHLLAHHYRDVIAYGAGWTDQERQQPIGDTGRHEPRQPDAILDGELHRALEDPDPLRGIAHLTASWAAAFVLDPDGITRTKTLGTERMARKLADALPGGSNPLRAVVWDFLRPMLSPRLAALHRDTFVFDEPVETTVELAARRAESDLADLDLPDDAEPAAA